MAIIYVLDQCTSHFILNSLCCIFQWMQCTLVFSPLEYIAWQQEAEPRGGSFMSEALIFERTSAPPLPLPPPESTNIWLLRGNWNTVWLCVSAVLITHAVLSSSSFSVTTLCNLLLWQSICLPLLITPPCPPSYWNSSILFSLFLSLFSLLCNWPTSQLTSLQSFCRFLFVSWRKMFRIIILEYLLSCKVLWNDFFFFINMYVWAPPLEAGTIVKNTDQAFWVRFFLTTYKMFWLLLRQSIFYDDTVCFWFRSSDRR